MVANRLEPSVVLACAVKPCTPCCWTCSVAMVFDNICQDWLIALAKAGESVRALSLSWVNGTGSFLEGRRHGEGFIGVTVRRPSILNHVPCGRGNAQDFADC